VLRKKIVGAAQNGHGEGEAGDEIKGPCPPDAPRQKDEGVGAGEITSVAGEDAHAGQEFVLGEVEALCDPGGLERGKIEASKSEGALETGDPFEAERTLAVVEDPGAWPGWGFITQFSNF